MIVDPADLVDLIALQPLTSRDGYLDRGAGVQTTGVPALVEFKMQRVVDFEGNEVMARAKLITFAAVDENTLVWLPDTDTATREGGKLPKKVDSATELGGGQTWFEVFL